MSTLIGSFLHYKSKLIEKVKKVVFSIRYKKAMKYLDNHAEDIVKDINVQKPGYNALLRVFKWQLISQEIQMFCIIGKQVLSEDIKWIVNRRGFNNVQKTFLIECMKHAGLGRKLVPNVNN